MLVNRMNAIAQSRCPTWCTLLHLYTFKPKWIHCWGICYRIPPPAAHLIRQQAKLKQHCRKIPARGRWRIGVEMIRLKLQPFSSASTKASSSLSRWKKTQKNRQREIAAIVSEKSQSSSLWLFHFYYDHYPSSSSFRLSSRELSSLAPSTNEDNSGMSSNYTCHMKIKRCESDSKDYVFLATEQWKSGSEVCFRCAVNDGNDKLLLQLLRLRRRSSCSEDK